MTDIKLLPLPGLPNIGAGGQWLGWSDDDMRDYALANVLHHTALLRYALDNAARSIKSLRGVRDAHAAEIERLRERAEQLAAALRDLLSAADQYPINYVHVGTIDRAKAILAAFDAALTEEAK